LSAAGYDAAKLPSGVRSRIVENGNGLSMHILEAGFDDKKRPCVLLLHGFPELAYSWRKIIPALAAAGFHAVAPDQRGYGRSADREDKYEDDIAPFGLLNLARDALGLVEALGHRQVAAVVGHDFGSPVAAWCALLYPQVFRSVALLSAPFGGPPLAGLKAATAGRQSLADALAALNPPRKHYQTYYSTRAANADMRDCAQGIHAFLRAYYHVKSADDKHNDPYPLHSWAVDELAKLPRYYIMDLAKDMAETVATEAPSASAIAACTWLPDDELYVYSGEFLRRGFQGGLQWYRSATDPRATTLMQRFSGRSIEVPCCFIAGRSDWGTYQSPGALQSMATTACSDFRGVHLIDGAGHWVQQEQPLAVADLLIKFLRR
jgi:pimeloyl-ACP methyl ester carboxylesterase